MVFKERIKHCEQHCRPANNQQAGAAEQSHGYAGDDAKDKEYYAECHILLGLEFLEHQVGNGKGLLVVHTCLVVKPVAEHIARRVKQYHSQQREYQHQIGLELTGNLSAAEEPGESNYYGHCGNGERPVSGHG